MKQKILVFFFCKFYFFLSIIQLSAQEIFTNDFHFKDSTQESMTIPFYLMSNLIVIPLQINDSDTLRFVLDSGLRTTLITELGMGDKLALNYARKTTVRGLGSGEDLEALHSYGNTFKLNDIIGFNQSIYVLLENEFNLSSKLGMRVHGIIGYDIFKNFIIEINYERKRITFYNPEFYKYNKRRNKETFPLIISSYKSYLQTTIVLEDNTEIPVKLLLDTGASDAVWLYLRSDSLIKLPAKVVDTYLGKGLNGDVHGKRGRLKSIKLGKFLLNRPTASFPDSASSTDIYKTDARNGNIGSEILRRFTVIIDYPNSQISFQKNSNYSSPFYYDLSGLEVNAPYLGIPYFEISKVRIGSQAYYAGLQAGDQIISINFKDATDYKLNDIHQLFNSKDGVKIRITVLRNGQKFKTKFKLEDLL